SRVDTDWRPGSSITWSGEFNGKAFEDKGEILEVDQNRLLKVTHFSPLSGQPDQPENYHTLTYELAERDGGTHVSLTQDNNGSEEEAEHAKANWDAMLGGLKKTVEGG
ncbi:MAG TPA: SRPBCC family protein, partial [Mycobacterium sp.]|nr:SRPBCC family protein [Mycobacterium sp.]